jgi:hypothetical protein
MLYAPFIHANFILYLHGKFHHGYQHIYKERVEEKKVMLVVEFSDTDTHQNTVMIVFMNTAFAFVAMPHSNPFM